ncbi:hypothetical protein DFH91_003170 [Clostridium saccharobutylicum]|nr:hypothetical protein [Clostridium saccharobutylicum]
MITENIIIKPPIDNVVFTPFSTAFFIAKPKFTVLFLG